MTDGTSHRLEISAAARPHVPAATHKQGRPAILILMPLATQRGGAEMALLHVLAFAQTDNHRLIVVFFEDGPMVSTARGHGIDARVITMGRLRQPLSNLAGVRQLVRLIRAEGVSLVFSWMASAHLRGALAAWWTRRPAGWFQHTIPTDAPWMDRLCTRLPTAAVLACSEWAGAAQRALRPQRPVHVVCPGVDLTRFDPLRLPAPAEARAQLKLPTTRRLLSIVGRLQRWKGMHVLVEALVVVRRSHPDAMVVIVGGEHEREPAYPHWLRQRIAELGLEAHVILAGYQTDVPLWMQAADVLVHASDREPFGMVVVEAMALGKPVIASRPGGPEEIITPDVDGQLVRFGDSSGLAEAINRYLADPPMAARCGEAARRRAAAFSVTRFAGNVLATLEQMSGDTKRSVETA